jgi:hypothetical protein
MTNVKAYELGYRAGADQAKSLVVDSLEYCRIVAAFSAQKAGLDGQLAIEFARAFLTAVLAYRRPV